MVWLGGSSKNFKSKLATDKFNRSTLSKKTARRSPGAGLVRNGNKPSRIGSAALPPSVKKSYCQNISPFFNIWFKKSRIICIRPDTSGPKTKIGKDGFVSKKKLK